MTRTYRAEQDITRYEMLEGQVGSSLLEAKNGEYVLYEDHVSAVAECNRYKGKNASMLRLLAKIRDGFGPITSGLEDEGDRVYFASSNDADWLRDVEEECMSWIIDAEVPHMTMTSDPYAEIRDLRKKADALEHWRHEVGKLHSQIDTKDAAIARLREALECIIREDDTGPMTFEIMPDGPSRALGGSGGKFASMARYALSTTQMEGQTNAL